MIEDIYLSLQKEYYLGIDRIPVVAYNKTYSALY